MSTQPREVLRLAPPVILWWVWVAFVIANAADFAIQGLSSVRFGAVVSAILLLVTGLAYTLALRPRVIMDGTGLTVVNPFRVHRVPWRLIQSVDTGEWVRVRYGADGDEPGGVAARTLYCWALYVSARAKRKIARGAPRPRRGLLLFRLPTAEDAGLGSASGESSRLPEEARYLASLPVAKAIATRLDTRASQERTRTAALGEESGQAAAASWSWPAFAAVVIPALILLIVALV